MKRKQHHYDSEEKIISKIDMKREQATLLNTNAKMLEEKSKAMAIESNKLYETAKTDEEYEEARNAMATSNECKEMAMKSSKQARRIEEVVLPQLGEVLSAFRTAPMLCITGNDHSVASSV